MGIIIGHYKNSFKTTRKVRNRGFFRGSIRHLKVKDDSGITPAVFFNDRNTVSKRSSTSSCCYKNNFGLWQMEVKRWVARSDLGLDLIGSFFHWYLGHEVHVTAKWFLEVGILPKCPSFFRKLRRGWWNIWHFAQWWILNFLPLYPLYQIIWFFDVFWC